MPLPASAAARAYLWDDALKGFGVMVTASGVRSYLVQYRVGGRGSPTRRVTIGKHGSPWTADLARDRAADLLLQVRTGSDPFDAERQRVEGERSRKADAEQAARDLARLAFEPLVRRYIDTHAKKAQPKSWSETESVLKRDVTPRFAAKPITKIEPAEITEAIEAAGERSPSAAVKVYDALSPFFAWAVSKHLIASSPMREMKPPQKAAKRDRWLDDAELRLVWECSDALGYPFGPLVQTLIATGQRLREASDAPPAEVDLERASWLIDGSRTKNGEPSFVPLNDRALAVLCPLPCWGKSARFIFSTTGRAPVSGFSKAKARLDELMLARLQKAATEAGEDPASVTFKPWRLHDLRRTLAVNMQRLGVKLEVTEAVLNHISGSRSGIVGVYQVYRYEVEKRDALAAWSRRLDEILSGEVNSSNVVTLKRA